MKYFNGVDWIILDAKDAESLNGKIADGSPENIPLLDSEGRLPIENLTVHTHTSEDIEDLEELLATVHVHDNLPVLDGLEEDEYGDLQYNGKPISGAKEFLYFPKEDEYVVEEGQLEFHLVNGVAAVGSIELYSDGLKIANSMIESQTRTSFKLVAALPVGSVLLARYVDKDTTAFPASGVGLGKRTDTVIATEEGQTDFIIPMSGFNPGKHKLEVNIGSTTVSERLYTVESGVLKLAEGVALGRKVDLVYIWLEKTNDDGLPVDGDNILSGSITEDKLSDELKEQIQNGGSGGGVSSSIIGNLEDLETTDKDTIVDAINEVKRLCGFGEQSTIKMEQASVEATVDRQKEFEIPIENFNPAKHGFIVHLGSALFHSSRYTVVGTKLVLNAEEAGIALGRTLDFLFVYLDVEIVGTSNFILGKDLPSLTNLREDLIIETIGWNEANDGGAGRYVVSTEEKDYSLTLVNGFFANIVNQDSVSYRCFGAPLNGVDDDTPFMQKAHSYCNEKKVLLKNSSGTIFKTNTDHIPVKYDVDLRGSVIFVNNNNCYSMYDILNDNETIYSYESSIDKSELKKGKNYFTMDDNSLPRNCVLHVKDNNAWSTRNDAGNIYDEFRGELMFHNIMGNCMGELIYGYDDEATDLYFKYSNYNSRQLTFKGCEIKIETTPNVTIGTINCKRHNTHISDFFINPKPNSLNNVQFKNSVIHFEDCYNVEVSNIIGFNIAGGEGENNGSGYTLRFSRCYKINMHDCNINGYWGCTAMNSVKDIKIDNCTLNRIDIHEYFMDMFIQNCKIYDWGINVGGGRGTLSFNNCKFINMQRPNVGGQTVVNINNTYGGLFDGTISFRDIEIIKDGLDVSLIKVNYVTGTNTRGNVKMPNVIADNIVCRELADDTKNLYIYSLSGATDNKAIKKANSIYLSNIIGYSSTDGIIPVELIKDSTAQDMYDTSYETRTVLNNVIANIASSNILMK